jgi:hypothetical protein
VVTGNQIVCHLIGDYIFQSNWMALNKVKSYNACFWHALVYSMPFLFLSPSLAAIAFIFASHFTVDRFSLAKYICWVTNFLGPPGFNPPFHECRQSGYPPELPVWLSTWLLIITDNTIHLLCNGFALTYL